MKTNSSLFLSIWTEFFIFFAYFTAENVKQNCRKCFALRALRHNILTKNVISNNSQLLTTSQPVLDNYFQFFLRN